MPDQVRAWHTGPTGTPVPWLPDPATGRWHSALGVSFAPQGFRLRVYDPDGNLIPTMEELDARMEELAGRAEELAGRAEAQAREIATLRAALLQRDSE